MGLSDNLRKHKIRQLKLIGGYSIRDYVPPRIGPFGRELHMPLGNYIGPRTDVKRRINEGVKPTTHTDAGAKLHDIAYYNIRSQMNRGLINRKQAYDLVKKADTRLIKSALVNKISINPIENMHANGAIMGMAGKKLLQGTNLLDELKYVSGDQTDELQGGRKRKTDKLKGLKRRFRKLKV
jgi:hypothetical protein